MSDFAIIALVFFSVLFALFAAAYFIRFGAKISIRQERHEYLALPQPQPQGFTRRLPGQETTYPISYEVRR